MYASSMVSAYVKKGAPLWVSQDEIEGELRRMHYKKSVQREISEWIARLFSMAFIAGQRESILPKVDERHFFNALMKMGYCDLNAMEIAHYMASNIPGLYAKGQSRKAIR